MDLIVTLEQRFERTPDGAMWTMSGFQYPFWSRYLEVYDQVRPVARVRDVAEPSSGAKRAEGPCVRFVPLPHYIGPLQYLVSRSKVRRISRSAMGDHAVLFRVSSEIANLVAPQFYGSARPYGVEVVGDPYDVFAPGTINHPLRPFFRWYFSSQLRRQCASAAATAYVTREALQRRYPAGGYAVGVSDVELPADAYVNAPRSFAGGQPVRLSFVGSLAQLYKAPDVLLQAVSQCVRRGLDLRLTLVGGGRFQPSLEQQAVALGLGDRVQFCGEVPAGADVRALLDRSDLFVLPSRVEGLPRALVEAMARGLPCIGTTVGGVPELLTSADMTVPGDPNALATKISEVATNPSRMAQMAERNLRIAREYAEQPLREKRRAFYASLRDATLRWLRGRSMGGVRP